MTKKIRRQVYDHISADNPENSQDGKIAGITGEETGIGAVGLEHENVGEGYGLHV